MLINDVMSSHHRVWFEKKLPKIFIFQILFSGLFEFFETCFAVLTHFLTDPKRTLSFPFQMGWIRNTFHVAPFKRNEMAIIETIPSKNGPIYVARHQHVQTII